VSVVRGWWVGCTDVYVGRLVNVWVDVSVNGRCLVKYMVRCVGRWLVFGGCTNGYLGICVVFGWMYGWMCC
jgi:hypothetical protein